MATGQHAFTVPSLALPTDSAHAHGHAHSSKADDDPTGIAVLTAAAGLASHYSRASSFREPAKVRAHKSPVVGDGGGGGGGAGGGGGGSGLAHARRNSMPNVNNLLLVPGSDASGSDVNSREVRIRRVRSFKTTSKGAIVNRGDSFKKKSTHSLMSTGSTVTDARASGANAGAAGGDYGGSSGPGYFRVNIMGAAGVGKTSLAHQFLQSDAVDHDDNGE
jgi:hypothetical protein